MSQALFIGGLLFPLISWITLAICAFAGDRTGRSTSGVFIPFVGPVLLSVWLIRSSEPKWMLVLPWIFDIGTLFFLAALPRILEEVWQTSSFTRLFKLSGEDGNQSVEITFHRGGHYVLRKRWTGSKGEMGVLSLGEPGGYTSQEDALILRSHSGRQRQVAPDGNGYVIRDAGALDDYWIDGMRLLMIRD